MALQGMSLTDMIEEHCHTQSDDWALILEVCEQASQDANLAKEALTALTNIFCDGGPRHVRLNAARLWAVMLHNCSDDFFARTCSSSFLAVIKEVIDQRQPGHPLRERLVETVGQAVYSWRLRPPHPLAILYLQVKPRGYPENGLPPNWGTGSEPESPNTPYTNETPPFDPYSSSSSSHTSSSTPRPPSIPPPQLQVPPERDNFASQFYTHVIGRSVSQTAPPIRTRQDTLASSSAPESPPYSAVRQAFTQAVIPLTASVAWSGPGVGSAAINNDDSRLRAPTNVFSPSSGPSSQQNPDGVFAPLWTSVAATAGAIPKPSESSISSLFASMKAMRGSKATMNIPIPDFCSQIVKLPRLESGKVIMLTRRRVVGAVTHEFLILQAVTPEGVPIWIRLDRRPLSGQRKPFFLLSSAATASDSAIFAASEEPLTTPEASKVDAIVPFHDSPSLHDLGKLLWFVETEAPDYRLRKENCWFFCSVIQDVLTEMFRGHNHVGTLAHPELGKDSREKIFARARGPRGLKPGRSD